jgi:flagellar protein FliS
MASLQTLRDRYVGDSIATASPARLLTMLFDRLCLDLEIAQDALLAGDLATGSQRLVHAQDIVVELQSSLDVAAWAGAAQLAQVYAFLFKRLIDANVAKDADIVGECRRLAEPLRGTWHEAAALQPARPTIATTA